LQVILESSLSANAGEAVLYQWKVDGTQIPTSTVPSAGTPNLIIDEVMVETAGW
jgi:hypothetical protein